MNAPRWFLTASIALAACGGLLSVSAPPAHALPTGAPAANTCLDCHRKEKEARLAKPTLDFSNDIHAQRGLGCVACHGGVATDPEISAMDPDKGYIGKPKRGEIAELCAKCHADAEFMKRYNPKPYIFSLAEFRTSVHCKKIAEGDAKVATCTNCHGVHGIRSHRDPASPVYHKNVPKTCAGCHNPTYMAGRTVPTNQYELYITSVHGKALLEKGDLSAPACNDCHGNHGAVPPNTRDISRVCANCHGREGELFAGTQVAETLQLEGKRGCVTCHGNHGVQLPTDAMIGLSGAGVCGQCHAPNSAGALAASRIVPQFHAMKRRVAEADSLLLRAERLGMPTDTGRELLKQAGDQVLNTRVTIHSFDSKLILTAISDGTGYADKAVVAGQKALKDWRDRRVGMAMTLGAIVFMIAVLLLKIRQGGPARESGEPGTSLH